MSYPTNVKNPYNMNDPKIEIVFSKLMYVFVATNIVT